ncbi:hypothetical protein C8R41DRAFT_918328 [Lentinula lateritia]|uniref:Uncharacterized protein n=1 Tax=Lentinula lateritia TaxID=40482 RepID=A0ABQ8VQ87_9AGAR|nr:hypothetical protein C8R41DRAFT_918328 [Lentinula lateritia]
MHPSTLVNLGQRASLCGCVGVERPDAYVKAAPIPYHLVANPIPLYWRKKMSSQQQYTAASSPEIRITTATHFHPAMSPASLNSKDLHDSDVMICCAQRVPLQVAVGKLVSSSQVNGPPTDRNDLLVRLHFLSNSTCIFPKRIANTTKTNPDGKTRL